MLVDLVLLEVDGRVLVVELLGVDGLTHLVVEGRVEANMSIGSGISKMSAEPLKILTSNAVGTTLIGIDVLEASPRILIRNGSSKSLERLLTTSMGVESR